MRRRLALLLLAAAAAAQEAPPSPAGERVTARRLSDVVAVREGERAAERVLYYFNPVAELAQGDELEQGSGGHSELLLSGGSLLELSATAHVILERLAPEGDVLSLPVVTSLQASSRERPLRLLLPGGIACDILDTSVRALLVPGRMALRNTGANPVALGGELRLERPGGDALAARSLILQRGEEVRVVLVAGTGGPDATALELWGAVPVRHEGGLELQRSGAWLRLSAADPLAVRLSVGGVRTVPRPGLAVRNPAHVELPSSPPPLTAEEQAAIEAATLESLRQLGYLDADGNPVEPAAEPEPQPAPEAPEAPAPADDDTPPDDEAPGDESP